MEDVECAIEQPTTESGLEIIIALHTYIHMYYHSTSFVALPPETKRLGTTFSAFWGFSSDSCSTAPSPRSSMPRPAGLNQAYLNPPCWLVALVGFGHSEDRVTMPSPANCCRLTLFLDEQPPPTQSCLFQKKIWRVMALNLVGYCSPVSRDGWGCGMEV